MSESVQTVPTGIEGLDELISGGFPKGRDVELVSGDAGQSLLGLATLTVDSVDDETEEHAVAAE